MKRVDIYYKSQHLVSAILGAAVAVLLGIAAGCAPGDPLDTIYTKDVLPGAGSHSIGSESRPYESAYVGTVYTERYATVRLPATSLLLDPDDTPTWTPEYGGRVLAFANEAAAEDEEAAYLIVSLPGDYLAGSPVIVGLQYAYSTSTTGEVARFGLDYTWTDINEAAAGAATIYALTYATTGAADIPRYSAFTELAGTGKAGGVIVARLFRNSTDSADTYAGNVYLLAVVVSYRTIAVGAGGPG